MNDERTARLNVKVSSKELADMKKEAAKRGISLSDHVRLTMKAASKRVDGAESR